MRNAGRQALFAACCGALLAAGAAHAAATFTVINGNDPGEGFNDGTPAAPVVGNPGTTVGEQRLNVVRAAADAWFGINSSVNIPILASFVPLDCDPTSGVLGAAGPQRFLAAIGGDLFPLQDTWYPFALANSLANRDLGPEIGGQPGEPNIIAVFNSDVDDDPSCLTGVTWWYGLGEPAPAGTLDLFGTVFHEIAHGLGFTTVVDRQTGAKLGGLDDAFMVHLEDHSTGERWPEMTDAERVESAVDTGDLHWVGANAVGNSGVLQAGTHPSGHIQMYAPDPLEPGSSTSHWDTALFPDEIMEPFATPDPRDRVTTDLMHDLGWPFTPRGSCVPSSTTACLDDNRFQVEVQWTTDSRTGPGVVVPGGSSDSSNFWFFGPDNWELLIKVLNGCGINNHYWVFFAAATDVEFRVTVTDTREEIAITYFNPLGHAADAETDTSAFATCP